MVRNNFLQSLHSGKTPKNLRMMIAQGLAPIPPGLTLELLVFLLKDPEPDVSAQAAQTLAAWDEGEVIAHLQNRDCAPAVLEHYGAPSNPDRVLQAVISNPSSPAGSISLLAQTVPAHLLEAILDNRNRLIDSPEILERILLNPSATPEIRRLAQEIENEFLGGKRRDYAVEEPVEAAPEAPLTALLEGEVPPEDLSLEGLPAEGEERHEAIRNRLSSLPVREKIRYALFGNREIRAVLVRDANKEVARNVLHSPKLTENEIESIAAMRSVTEEILREIGNNREWTKSYSVVQNLVKNPKTPPLVAQRLVNRLRSQDLALLTRDRGISDAVRHHAARTLKQRSSGRPGQ